MDLDIIKIAADTSNNKVVRSYTHKSKYKNKTCGDIIEIRVNIKNDHINDIGYQAKSCVYCQASASLISKILVNKKRNKITYLVKNLINFFDEEINPLPKQLIKLAKIFNKKNTSRKNCVIMPIIALKKLGVDE
tara:strand:- start:6237 stop:6638 length:402 start_codon:yes stop_codon:yes gene_type:complete